MPGGIRKEDIEDLDIVDSSELASDGMSAYSSGVTVVSCESSTKEVVLSGTDLYLIHDKDVRVESGDKITISGSSAADGSYTIDEVITDTKVSVVESISDSTGGAASFSHPSGAYRVGFNSTGLVVITANNLQDALEELDAASGGSGVTAEQHKALRQLVHFIETNSPGDGFGDGPYYCEINYTSSVFPTDETWYETSDKLKKICRWDATYNSNKTLATEKWTVYKSDGSSPSADATDAISYSGVIETSRTRSISVY